MKSHSIVIQHDLNMLEVGSVFDSTDHLAQLLTLLFFAMMFAPGLPLLMPLCCFAFVLYFRVDKHLLCRYYQKPPNIGDAAIRVVLQYLPYAAVLRLAFGCWMLGNTSILQTTISSSTQAYANFLKTAQQYSGGNAAINAKIFQTNTFPLFLFFLFLLLAIFIVTAWKQLPIYWIYKLLHVFLIHTNRHFQQNSDILKATKHDNEDDYEGGGDGTRGNSISTWDLLRLDDPLRQQSSPYTGEFYRLVKHKDEIPDTCFKMFAYAYLTQLSEVEIEDGYKMQDRGDFVVKIKVWTTFGQKKVDGTRSRHGELKKTYEVIADHRCYTYDIEKVPEYRVAIQGLREGTTSIVDYMEQHRGTQSSQRAGRNLLFEKAGIASSIIADYEKRKKHRNVGVEGMEFFEEIETANLYKGDDEEDGEDAQIVSKEKKKKPSASHSTGYGQQIAVEATPKTEAVSTHRSDPQNREGTNNKSRNFTFDDFNLFDEPVNGAIAAPPPPSLPLAETAAATGAAEEQAGHDSKEDHSRSHHSHHDSDKKKKKKKKGEGEHHNNHTSHHHDRQEV